MTNGDLIRQMPDEQLARAILCDWCRCCVYTDNKSGCMAPNDLDCAEGIIEWLKREVKCD